MSKHLEKSRRLGSEETAVIDDDGLETFGYQQRSRVCIEHLQEHRRLTSSLMHITRYRKTKQWNELETASCSSFLMSLLC